MATRKEPGERELLNRYSGFWLSAGKAEEGSLGEVNEDILELAKKQAKKFDEIICELKYRWLTEEIEKEIENCIITKELMRNTGKWDDIEAQDKKLRNLYAELAEAARGYEGKKE